MTTQTPEIMQAPVTAQPTAQPPIAIVPTMTAEEFLNPRDLRFEELKLQVKGPDGQMKIVKCYAWELSATEKTKAIMAWQKIVGDDLSSFNSCMMIASLGNERGERTLNLSHLERVGKMPSSYVDPVIAAVRRVNNIKDPSPGQTVDPQKDIAKNFS